MTTIAAKADNDTFVHLGEVFTSVEQLLLFLSDAGASFPTKEQLHFSSDIMNYVARQMCDHETDLIWSKLDPDHLKVVLEMQLNALQKLANHLDIDLQTAIDAGKSSKQTP